MQEKFQTVCSQLIDQEDLSLDDTILDDIMQNGISIDICDQRKSEIKIFSKARIAISDIIPIMHDFGFRVVDEVTLSLEHLEGRVFITKLDLDLEDTSLLVRHSGSVKVLFILALKKKIESGLLFSLTYFENFSLDEIVLFRAILSYSEQLFPDMSRSSMIDCIVKYPNISSLFLHYFYMKFDPSIIERQRKVLSAQEELISSFKSVDNINDDRVLKLFFEILKSIVRTNYFLGADALSLKIELSSLAKHFRNVQPSLEIFVYSHEFSGTHLRMGRVARGGLRWSNRIEDFRTEIKSLMSTQEGKNAVIVPKGAKGGFVIFGDRSDISREKFESCYVRFINALLDVVDNKIDSKIVRDSKIVAYDEDDPYFVVAADRGTSSMSDKANSISESRNFWLRDAFASGGSHGYHHKKLGITAKGALRCTQRYFIEKGVDFYKEAISVVGVGSMSGDVFGNGMLESRFFKLIGAISHDEIFIDPHPNLEEAYLERKRLFSLKRGKWSKYDVSKISEGGGVFKRSCKNIELSLEIRALIGSNKKSLSGEELAKEILKLPVDMLYFGGVGTYVKASSERNISLGDKENEFVRINGDELRAYCVCEGANLALSMGARFEYVQHGGKINLDSIDNSAGVDTSDHEVNFKILLNTLVSKGEISEDERDKTLDSLSDFVVNSVLWTNYFQSLSISLDALRSKDGIEIFKKSLIVLEKGIPSFKRGYFEIPKDHNFVEVLDSSNMISRPILATMTLYAKIFLQDLLSSTPLLIEDGFFYKFLFKYFPKPFVALYEDEVKLHPLRVEIVAMIIANKIINLAGVTFISDYEELGKDKFFYKIKSYLITNELFDANDVRYQIYRHDYHLSVDLQYKILLDIENKIIFNLDSFEENFDLDNIDFSVVSDYKKRLCEVIDNMNLSNNTPLSEYKKLNSFIEKLEYMKYIFLILKIKSKTEYDFSEIAKLFYKVIEVLEIDVLMDLLENVTLSSYDDKLLQKQLRLLLGNISIEISKDILHFLRKGESLENGIQNYLQTKNFDIDNNPNFKDRPTIQELSIGVNRLLLLR